MHSKELSLSQSCLCGEVMWGSPMLLPSTSVLSVPLTAACMLADPHIVCEVFLDVMLHEAEPGTAELFGQVLVLLSVAACPNQELLLKRGLDHAAPPTGALSDATEI